MPFFFRHKNSCSRAAAQSLSLCGCCETARPCLARHTPSRHLIIRGGQSSVFIFNYIYMQPTLGREQKPLQIGPIPPQYYWLVYHIPARGLIINYNVHKTESYLHRLSASWWELVRGQGLQHLFIFKFKVKNDSTEPVWAWQGSYNPQCFPDRGLRSR